MTTPITNLDCDGFALALADYLEPDASAELRAAVAAHAERCDDCRALLADLGGIRAQAAALPRLTPSRDLWSGIAERIDAPVIPMGAGSRARTIRVWRTPAVAAAALIALTAGVTHVLTRAYFAPPSPVGTPTIAAVTPAAPANVPNAVITSTATEEPAASRVGSGSRARLVSREEAGEPVLDSEIAKLRRIVNERRADLDPRTVDVLERSMAVIDSAIAQSRAALAKDPASGFLATELNRSLEKKVELLRTATLLPVGT